MGIPLDAATHILVDNMSVVHNTSRPESTRKKKSKHIANHFIRESVAAQEIKIVHEVSQESVSNMLVKFKPGPERKRLAQMVLYLEGISQPHGIMGSSHPHFPHVLSRSYMLELGQSS